MKRYIIMVSVLALISTGLSQWGPNVSIVNDTSEKLSKIIDECVTDTTADYSRLYGKR